MARGGLGWGVGGDALKHVKMNEWVESSREEAIGPVSIQVRSPLMIA
ncbi:hypothetical protein NG791_20425 [Laspinema sp. D1]|nr:hypothetical protein [Laspinema sp. D2b]